MFKNKQSNVEREKVDTDNVFRLCSKCRPSTAFTNSRKPSRVSAFQTLTDSLRTRLSALQARLSPRVGSGRVRMGSVGAESFYPTVRCDDGLEKIRTAAHLAKVA